MKNPLVAISSSLRKIDTVKKARPSIAELNRRTRASFAAVFSNHPTLSKIGVSPDARKAASTATQEKTANEPTKALAEQSRPAGDAASAVDAKNVQSVAQVTPPEPPKPAKIKKGRRR